MSFAPMPLSEPIPPAAGPARRLVVLSWLLQVIVAGILAQTLYFKFTAAPESVSIFRTLGLEPWGRIGSGIVELLACVLLLVPRTVTIGALLSAVVISGAIASHLTRLGIAVRGDGGLLFSLAVVVLILSIVILMIRRGEIPLPGHRTDPQSIGARSSCR